MRVYTSYFYKIRFFEPRMIPYSTAVWDPKWYHDFKNQNYVFLDKRGVLNGSRANILHPDGSCDNYCVECKHIGDPETCLFLKKYREQLDKIDFSWFMQNMLMSLKSKAAVVGTNDSIVPVFIVHEAPDNKCSERRVIQEWFIANGVECSELEI